MRKIQGEQVRPVTLTFLLMFGYEAGEGVKIALYCYGWNPQNVEPEERRRLYH